MATAKKKKASPKTRKQSKANVPGKSSEAEIKKAFSDKVDLTDFEKALVRERWLNPRISTAALGRKYGVVKSTISVHLNKPQVKRAINKLQADVFEQVKSLQVAATLTYLEVLSPRKDPKTGEVIVDENGRVKWNAPIDERRKAAKDIMTPVFEQPAALPDAPDEEPEFIYK